jgi:hypothetical protein
MKEVQATGEALEPKKKTSSTKKHEISELCNFVRQFCYNGSGSTIPMRIRINNTGEKLVSTVTMFRICLDPHQAKDKNSKKKP